jgi:hypothetical protein
MNALASKMLPMSLRNSNDSILNRFRRLPPPESIFYRR